MAATTFRLDPADRPQPPVGSYVEHSVWGPGRVLESAPGTIRVQYDRHGVKEALWVFAQGRFKITHDPQGEPICAPGPVSAATVAAEVVGDAAP